MTDPIPQPTNDAQELYALQHAITGAGGTLTPDVHKAIDALREAWDRELKRAQAEAFQYRTALQGTARAAAPVPPSAPADRAAEAEAAIARVRGWADGLDTYAQTVLQDDSAVHPVAAAVRQLLDAVPTDGPSRVADEAQQATPCSQPNPCEDGGDPCAVHEREQAHAEGEHCFCGPECDEARQPETQADRNSGLGWYEVINPRNATTCIAYAHEDGSLYLPEGDDLTPDEFAFAAARGQAHRLVRADDPAAVSQPAAEA